MRWAYTGPCRLVVSFSELLIAGLFINMRNISLWAHTSIWTCYQNWAHVVFPYAFGYITHGFYRSLRHCMRHGLPGQHFLRLVDISRHHFTPAFGYVIRLRFQCLGLCSGGSFSPTRRLDATGFLGLGWCCWRSSSSVHQRPISDFPCVCVSVYSIALPLYARTLIYVSTPNRFSLPPSAFIAQILFAEAC